ncbi:MAG: hypothetical protein ABIQ88_05260 [Chitinophagaceae bacterium]
MKNNMLIPFLLLATMSAAGQTTETIQVAAGGDIAAAVSPYGIYRLPAFTNGTVFFKDGKLAKEVLNYNILNDQVMYIDKKGDTLAIAFPEETKKIEIGSVVLYYDKKGYLESIAAAPEASLVIRRKVILHYEKQGAFGISNSTNGIDSYTTFTSNNASYHLYAGENAVLKKSTAFFLLTNNSKLLPASRTNFLAQFTKNKQPIESHLANTKVNFNNLQDLILLMHVSSN